METIKNYLETMFRNLPDTDQVRRAKNELLQMMEDKFTELRNNGISENEAVGTVISEFGNLEELAQDLGLESVLNENKENINRRNVSFDEVKNYMADRKSSIITRAIGVLCFITCVTPMIIISDLFNSDVIGLAIMFAFIAAGIALNILASSKMEDWDYLTKEPCSISQESIEYVAEQRKTFKTKYNVMHAVGVLFCVLCFVPAAIMGEFSFVITDALSGISLFWCVGIGVALLIYSSKTKDMHETLLSINSETTIGGSYTKAAKKNDKEVTYKNKTVKVIMEVYWSTVTCIYLAWSFITFDWHFTWIIWPVASVIHSMINGIYGEEK